MPGGERAPQSLLDARLHALDALLAAEKVTSGQAHEAFDLKLAEWGASQVELGPRNGSSQGDNQQLQAPAEPSSEDEQQGLLERNLSISSIQDGLGGEGGSLSRVRSKKRTPQQRLRNTQAQRAYRERRKVATQALEERVDTLACQLQQAVAANKGKDALIRMLQGRVECLSKTLEEFQAHTQAVAAHEDDRGSCKTRFEGASPNGMACSDSAPEGTGSEPFAKAQAAVPVDGKAVDVPEDIVLLLAQRFSRGAAGTVQRPRPIRAASAPDPEGEGVLDGDGCRVQLVGKPGRIASLLPADRGASRTGSLQGFTSYQRHALPKQEQLEKELPDSLPCAMQL